MIEQCEKCKHKEVLNDGIVGCFYMGADCCKGEMFSQITNADRIRAMSDEELADFIDRCEMGDIDYANTFCDLCNGQYECEQCRLDWLQQPSE